MLGPQLVSLLKSKEQLEEEAKEKAAKELAEAQAIVEPVVTTRLAQRARPVTNTPRAPIATTQATPSRASREVKLQPRVTVPRTGEERHQHREHNKRIEEALAQASAGLAAPTPLVDAAPRKRVGHGEEPVICVVLGTYNRKKFLEEAVFSIRRACGTLPYVIVVVDGGSVDGSRKWLSEQPDVVTIEQSGPLSGAVKAFNLGFGYAVERNIRYVMHLNDDCIVMGTGAIERAAEILEADKTLGAVAFAFDLRGAYTHEFIHEYVYVNFGLIRLQAGMAVAKVQGDLTGRAWWNPLYRTYGADSEFGAWMHGLGWKIFPANELRVHDRTSETNDELRELNQSNNPARKDSKIFWDRWPTSESVKTGKPRL